MVVNAGAIRTIRRAMMPMTTKSSSNVKALARSRCGHVCSGGGACHDEALRSRVARKRLRSAADTAASTEKPELRGDTGAIISEHWRMTSAGWGTVYEAE